jgi:Ca2+-transporting ATPase
VVENKFKISGLTDKEVLVSRVKYGTNKLAYKTENGLWDALKRIVKDPMMILLLTASSIYFISGKTGDGIFLSAAILFQTSISFYQYSRSKNALAKLKDLSQPHCKVIRNGTEKKITSEEVVVGDSLVVEEGSLIAADGEIVHSNDFSVNESILTGESLAVTKDPTTEDHFIYSGTSVSAGLAIATITAIGNETRLGKIGVSLENIEEEKTPLEIQISNFVKKMALAGAIIFAVVWGLNYWHSRDLMNSLLQSLTLAMSILPEEIPVAFTTFMALGARRLMKMGIIVKQMKTVETLGSATVICTDKTGTITENKMSLAKLFLLKSNSIVGLDEDLNEDAQEILRISMFASETNPFDAMELALHESYKSHTTKDESKEYELIHEYPLGGKPPMMTHVFKNKQGQRIIAAKGAPEAFFPLTSLSNEEKKHIEDAIQTLTSAGFRVLAVGQSTYEGDTLPDTQFELHFELIGVVAFYDPPKKNIQTVLEAFYNAGISVKIITGDNAETTTSIAKQIGFRGFENSITGDELMKLSDDELQKTVMDTSIFARMFPEAKLKIINALKAQDQIVAMTGDGVNDGPALKAAHIGIAMGKKGTEIAKEASSLILLEDDLSKMVDAVAMGRKIYTNLKKAIQYIISIHKPIILIVFVPLALGWLYPNIFSPIHIIFLEIIMGPTCSIIYENEPMEKNTMTQKPKALSKTFFNWKELSVSILQGIIISAGTLFVYQYNVMSGNDEAITRTMTFTTLIAANILLTLINRSFYYSIWTTLKYKNSMVLFIIAITLALLALMLFVPPITAFFQFEPLTLSQLVLSFGIGFASVIWFEFVKLHSRQISNVAA